MCTALRASQSFRVYGSHPANGQSRQLAAAVADNRNKYVVVVDYVVMSLATFDFTTMFYSILLLLWTSVADTATWCR